MCGIFGIVATPESRLPPDQLRRLADRLFLLSESRGKEAAGIALRNAESILVYKQPVSASSMIRQRGYRKLFDEPPGIGVSTEPVALIGHSRLVTNGAQTVRTNNQPVIRDGLVGIHNGIIVNDAQLWQRYPELTRQHQVDTEVFLALTGLYRRQAPDLAAAVAQTFGEIEGTASVALLSEAEDQLVLATNNGSLYLLD